MKPHVLIVDDSVTVRVNLHGLLGDAGFTVTACENKMLAQKALRSRQFSLVVLDVVLPDGDGIDLLREIRSTRDLMRVPIILLSSKADVWARIAGLRSGADEYIGKPFDGAQLVRRAIELAGQLSAAAPDSGPGEAPPASSHRTPPASPPRSEGAAQRAPLPLLPDEPGSLYARVIAASGLSNIIGPTTIKRACQRVGVDPHKMSPADLARALPSIQEALRVFLPEDEYLRSMVAITSLTQGG